MEHFGYALAHDRHSGRAAHQHYCVDSGRLEFSVADCEFTSLERARDEWRGDLFEGVACEMLANRMAGEFDDDVGLGDVSEIFLGVLGSHAGAVPDVAIELEGVGYFGKEPIDQRAIYVVAAEMSTAVGCEHLEDPFLDTENRDVESAAAEVVHRNVAGGHLVEAVGERRGGRLVDEAHHLETGEA